MKSAVFGGIIKGGLFADDEGDFISHFASIDAIQNAVDFSLKEVGIEGVFVEVGIAYEISWGFIVGIFVGIGEIIFQLAASV